MFKDSRFLHCSYFTVLWTRLSKHPQTSPKRPQTWPNFFAILALPWSAENDVISLLIGRAECDSIVDKLGHFLNDPIRRKMTTFSTNRAVGFGDAFIYLGPRGEGFRNCNTILSWQLQSVIHSQPCHLFWDCRLLCEWYETGFSFRLVL